jgi:hypothetical protein
MSMAKPIVPTSGEASGEGLDRCILGYMDVVMHKLLMLIALCHCLSKRGSEVICHTCDIATERVSAAR